MSRLFFKRLFLLSVVTCSLIFGSTELLRAQSMRRIGYGDTLPKIETYQSLLPQETQYLQASDGKTLLIADPSVELLIIEFTSKYCNHCATQAPVFNELLDAIEKDPVLKSKVKMLGIGVGNNRSQVESMKKEREIMFPIIPDPSFKIHELMGEPNTPYTILARRDKEKWVVGSAHMGEFKDLEAMIEEVKAVLQYNIQFLKPRNVQDTSLSQEADSKSVLSDTELINLLTNATVVPGGKVLNVQKVNLPKDDTVYVGTFDLYGQKRKIVSKVINQKSLCDFCHYNRFIITFDETGKVINFIPLELAKYNNEPWDEADVNKLRSRIVGTSILKDFAFDRRVDAVSGATLSSLIIFSRLNHLKETWKNLKESGYLK